MGIPVEGLITNLREAKDRVTDLTRAAEHILSVNNHFEILWEKQFEKVDTDPRGPKVYNHIGPMAKSSLEAPEPLLKKYALPDGISSPRTKFYDDSRLNMEMKDDPKIASNKDARSFSFADPVTSFSRLKEEPRVSDWTSFFPHTSKSGRRAGIPPKRYRQEEDSRY